MSDIPSRHEPEGSSRLPHDIRRGLVDDVTFDAVYDEPIRARSARFWTPVAVAARVARLFSREGARRVLDVGSGAGKFCLTAACVCPEVEFTGIEQRPHLVEAARRAGARLGLENACFFTGDVTSVPWLDFDGLYFFNPFAENIYHREEQLDQTVELSVSRFTADIQRVFGALAAAPVGMCFITYHGLGGPIPGSYDLVHREHACSDWLRVWVKRRQHDDRGQWYVEGYDDVVLVGSERSGKR